MSSSSIRSSQATLAGLAPGSRRPVAGRSARAFDLVLVWLERATQRRHLRALDHHMLRDIGLSRADAESEAVKPFWRP